MDFLLQPIGLAYGEASLEDHGARFKPLISADMKQTSVKGLNWHFTSISTRAYITKGNTCELFIIAKSSLSKNPILGHEQKKVGDRDIILPSNLVMS